MDTQNRSRQDVEYYSFEELDTYMEWVRRTGSREDLPTGESTMNYPSTTQALFALIVMIIVLLFILVYCCWGTFSCARQDDASTAEEGTAGSQQQNQQGGGQMVIVPFSNMLYVGDPESRRIYQIPLDQDKPPAYTEVFSAGPPPPYTADTTNETPVANPTVDSTASAEPENRGLLPDLPPSYEDCLSDASTDGKNQATASESRQGESTSTELTAQSLPAVPNTQRDNNRVSDVQPSTRPLNVSIHTEIPVPSNVSHSWRVEGIILRPANLPMPERQGSEGDGDSPTTPPRNTSSS